MGTSTGSVHAGTYDGNEYEWAATGPYTCWYPDAASYYEWMQADWSYCYKQEESCHNGYTSHEEGTSPWAQTTTSAT